MGVICEMARNKGSETVANGGNLIPNYTGEIRNPKGRGRGVKNRSTVLRELYDMVLHKQDLSGVEKKMTTEVALMTTLIQCGLDGDIAAIKEAQDSVYGKITDKFQHGGDPENPMGGAGSLSALQEAMLDHMAKKLIYERGLRASSKDAADDADEGREG